MSGQKILKEGQAAGAPLQCRTNAPCRILVVEDEPDIRRINAVVLHRAGYYVDTAEDGRAGWHAVRHAPESYALLITGHNMPGLTGLALVKKLRDARMTLPVIMATGALPGVDLFDRYPWLQPAVALLKPYSIGQLLGTVEKVLRATVIPDDKFVPPPNWQGQPTPNGLQL
jgi:DNA-binding response OmpR family regulator